MLNRITSTYVENTLSVIGITIGHEDHLHIRGEYELLTVLTVLRSGSPPHTWRILTFYGHLRPMLRITSTYVENTRIVADCFRL